MIHIGSAIAAWERSASPPFPTLEAWRRAPLPNLPLHFPAIERQKMRLNPETLLPLSLITNHTVIIQKTVSKSPWEAGLLKRFLPEILQTFSTVYPKRCGKSHTASEFPVVCNRSCSARACIVAAKQRISQLEQPSAQIVSEAGGVCCNLLSISHCQVVSYNSTAPE